MRKLSKSDLPDQPHDEFWDWHNRQPRCQHFAVGTRVASNKRHGEIEGKVKGPHGETWLQIRWDDGSMSSIKPIALNR